MPAAPMYSAGYEFIPAFGCRLCVKRRSAVRGVGFGVGHDWKMVVGVTVNADRRDVEALVVIGACGRLQRARLSLAHASTAWPLYAMG